MARREALLRLHAALTQRRTELYRRLGIELRDLGNPKHSNASGDPADAAFDSGFEAIASQLAELEARELKQIERAIDKMRQGTYGQCELCQIRIPVARLNALPYSTMCVKCQREVETNADWRDDLADGDWEKIGDYDSPFDDRRGKVDINSFHLDVSK